jgi:REP element-mobilizing transposase RayT
MLRGIERSAIFLDHVDRGEFLRRLAILIVELGFRLFAFVLKSNHVHLVLRSGGVHLSRLMARLGTGYARYFNERHGRVGHLFQNRFRSRLLVDDADLLGVVLYVCRNPFEGVRRECIAALETSPWCSVGGLLGRRPVHTFEAVEETLALFDADPERARRALRAGLELPAGSLPAAPALGVAARPRQRPAITTLEALWQEVSAQFRVPEDGLRAPQRDRRIAEAREVLVSRAARELGLSGAEIGRRIGVTRAGVSRMLARARNHPQGTS